MAEADLELNARAATVFKWGFRVSAALLALGIVVTLARGNDISEAATPLRELLPRLFDGDGGAIVTLSIVTMIVTPVVTVLLVALGFFAGGDRRYGRVSLVVLGVLTISVVAALVRG